MCNCSSFRENCVTHARTHARTHAHGANYDLPPASRAGDKKLYIIQCKTCHTKHFQITVQNTEKNVKKGHLGECLWPSYTG